MTRARLIGSAVKRVEDPRLITGAGTYIGDLAPVGMVHAEFVRSQYAHARINHIDTAAALAMIDSLAADVKGSGLTVNSILPSIIDTPANRRAMPDADFAAWPKPEEIAAPILFLCTEHAGFITGEILNVNGGAVLVG